MTVEDKDPAVLWSCEGPAMMARWLGILGRALQRWRIVKRPLQQILGWYRLLLDFTLPKSLCRQNTALSARNLPNLDLAES